MGEGRKTLNSKNDRYKPLGFFVCFFFPVNFPLLQTQLESFKIKLARQRVIDILAQGNVT